MNKVWHLGIIVCAVMFLLPVIVGWGQQPLPTIYCIDVEIVEQGQGTVTVDRQPLYGAPTSYSSNDTIYYLDSEGTGFTLGWTAEASEGYEFDHWELGPIGALTTSTNNPTTLDLTPGGGSPSFWTVRAVFVQAPPTQYTLTMAVAGNGTTTPPVGTHTYAEETVVPLTATPDAGWVFDHWSGDVTGTVQTASITMDGNKSVTAHFVQAPPTQYTLTMAVIGSGTTTPVGTHTYDEGTVVPLTATQDAGWVFDHWSGDVAGFTNPTSITMNGNKSVTAHFVQAPPGQYTLTVNIVGSGTVTKTPDKVIYQYMEVVSLNPTPSAGWQFVGWSGDLSGSDAPVSITMDWNKSVTAHFAPPNGLDDDVEAGPGNWTAESLWHITDTRSYSPSHSWWFGDARTGTYGAGEYSSQSLLPRRRGDIQPMAAGGRVQGALTSEAISVSGWDQAVALSFWHWRHVEYYPDGAYDRTYVQVRFLDGGWQTVWAQDSREPSQENWEEVSVAVAIPDRATQMWVRFVFDSVDGLHNDYPGWFIDDIRFGPPEVGTAITVIAPLVNGTVGQSYGPVQLGASGGVAPYTWVWRPAVPGLSLDQRTGTISGTPTTAGTFDVMITAMDSTGKSGALAARIVIDSDGGCACSLFSENFSDVTTWTMTGLWHVDSGLNCITYASMVDKYAYFGRNGACSYATGSRVEGGLQSPVIDIPDCVETVVVEFDQFRHVEYYPKAYDKTWLEISFDGATWELLWYRDSSSVSPEGSHVQVGRGVPSGATQMRIRFQFNSVDSFYNDYPGWAIDNVEVLNADCVGTLGLSAASMGVISLPKATPRDQISVTNVPNPITDVHTTIFTVRGVDVETMKIQIFDLSGALMYEEEVAGNELEWHTNDSYGEYLANGVYLYRALVKVGGEWVKTSIQKLVILR